MTNPDPIHLAPKPGATLTKCGRRINGIGAERSTLFRMNVDCENCITLMNEEETASAPLPRPAHEDKTPDMIAVHKHDCEDCILLGGSAADGRLYDLYFHPGEDATVVARYGSEGGDYFSGLENAYNSRILALAALRAIVDGHLRITAKN